jgi:hypothetical protein
MTGTAALTAEQIAALDALPTDEMRRAAIDIITHTEAKRAEIAASDYRRTVSLRRGADEVILTVAPAGSGISWEITGAGYTHRARGRTDVGDVQSRYRAELDEAKAYANGWVKSLTDKGYRIAR